MTVAIPAISGIPNWPTWLVPGQVGGLVLSMRGKYTADLIDDYIGNLTDDRLSVRVTIISDLARGSSS